MSEKSNVYYFRCLSAVILSRIDICVLCFGCVVGLPRPLLPFSAAQNKLCVSFTQDRSVCDMRDCVAPVLSTTV